MMLKSLEEFDIALEDPLFRPRGMGYPWATMKIGDSFRFRLKAASARSIASRASAKFGRHFIVSLQGKEVWCYRVGARREEYPWGRKFKFNEDVTEKAARTMASRAARKYKMKLTVEKRRRELWCWRVK
jgi:hypothetical protein